MRDKRACNRAAMVSRTMRDVARRMRMRCAREGAALQAAAISPIRSTTGYETPSSPCTRRRDEICTDGFSSSNWPEQISGEEGGGGGGLKEERRGGA
ncbi:hypothetical protein F511_28407 [Dorcoceras hygrometricum]|uniref:Uncharacterized protein n=1 Tax=Dorcoceras hygrometricum TaxID=472368 RepID=A0A2Z7ACM6_9LAMI|nr:hypothetical protein F511_28407 [Dorcoceras hygrometricum]